MTLGDKGEKITRTNNERHQMMNVHSKNNTDISTDAKKWHSFLIRMRHSCDQAFRHTTHVCHNIIHLVFIVITREYIQRDNNYINFVVNSRTSGGSL